MSRTPKNPLESIRDAWEWLRFGFTLVVPPIIGVYLITCTGGKTRLIGLGLLTYSFALFVVLPFLVVATSAKKGSVIRLFAAAACFILSVFALFYLNFASTKQVPAAYIFAMLPISILGLIFAGWWVRDLLA